MWVDSVEICTMLLLQRKQNTDSNILANSLLDVTGCLGGQMINAVNSLRLTALSAQLHEGCHAL